jgi:hypothetical protein
MKLNLMICIIAFYVQCFQTANAQQWRSTLYPENWQPGLADNQGRFLHDFSYAGYHSGLVEIPQIKKNIIDITKKPYNADNTGKIDITSIAQKAIDDAGKAGGGVVYFPKGEYIFSVNESSKEGVRVKYNNVILRGTGADKTFFKNTSTFMRNKNLISFNPEGGDWVKAVGESQLLPEDLLTPTVFIKVKDASKFKVGDLVTVMTDCTDDFMAEHKSTGLWSTKIRGVRFLRTIVKVDVAKNVVEIDTPTRYFLKVRDNARIFKTGKQLEECGIEDLSIGNIQNPKETYEDWLKDNALWNKPKSGYFDVHGSHLIEFNHSLNCWIRNVATYRPRENKDDFHLLSNCLRIVESRFISVEKCNFQQSQYEGGGGNGYMYTLEGNDCLLKECHGEHARHSFDFKQMSSSGNVIYKCSSKDPMYSSDFHMWLSMANLFDSFVANGDYLDARFRPWGDRDSIHSYSTTQSVFWNTIGLKAHKIGYLIESRQWGWGYVIGTSGKVSNVQTKPVSGIHEGLSFDSEPEDFVEGEGKGATLIPQSLYKDQLEKRKTKLMKTKK